MASSPAADLHPSSLPVEGILLAEELLDLARGDRAGKRAGQEPSARARAGTWANTNKV
jgi:hypothetical protein